MFVVVGTGQVAVFFFILFLFFLPLKIYLNNFISNSCPRQLILLPVKNLNLGLLPCYLQISHTVKTPELACQSTGALGLMERGQYAFGVRTGKSLSF